MPDAVIGRALTCGGNEQHSIERIVAFFQKGLIGSAAASFIEKGFGEGVTIAKKEYSLWFDHEGFRVAPERSAFGPGSTLISWVNAAVMTSNLLWDGMFAAQDKIDAALDKRVPGAGGKAVVYAAGFQQQRKGTKPLAYNLPAFRGQGVPGRYQADCRTAENPGTSSADFTRAGRIC